MTYKLIVFGRRTIGEVGFRLLGVSILETHWTNVVEPSHRDYWAVLVCFQAAGSCEQ